MSPSQPGSLAERLVRMRVAAGLNGDQLAARLAARFGWAEKTGPPKVSKIENGRQAPTADIIRAWAEATGHPGETDELLDILADMQTVHVRRRRMLRKGEAPLQEDYDQRAQAATIFRNFEVAFIPGLLQTSAYARSIIKQVAAVFGITDVDEAVQARMRRQDILYDSSKTFEFVFTEAALRILSCPRHVMLGQLDRLLSLSADNVKIGIIPFGSELTITPVNGFLLLDDQLIVETYCWEDQEHGDESATHRRIFDMLMADALKDGEARRLIVKAAEDLREGRLHVQLRYNYRVYPTPCQCEALCRAVGCARVVFNDALAARRAAHETGEPYITDAALSARLTAAKDTPERAWLGEVSSVVLQQALADLNAA